jgi:hypothetical protein
MSDWNKTIQSEEFKALSRTPAPEGEAWRHVSQEEVAQAAKFASTNLAPPVVSVGREEIIKTVRPVLDRHPMIDSSQSHKLDIQAGWVADAILAALRPTDTGRETVFDAVQDAILAVVGGQETVGSASARAADAILAALGTTPNNERTGA